MVHTCVYNFITWSYVFYEQSFFSGFERNSLNFSYIFILSVNFENLTVGLHVLIISFIIAKFQENQRSIAISPNKCLNFKFLWSKIVCKK